ncbi:hypothetical protein MMC25_000479 [Agyrium rufum]|nr:hypothetical protein [Agyrium rufum]
MKSKSKGSPFTAEFKIYVEQQLKSWKIPGVSLAVIDDDQVYYGSYGIARFPSSPVEPSTLFFAGSTTKAVLGTAWVIYIASGENQAKVGSKKISLQTPLCSIIRDDFVMPDEYATANATIEDALCHRTGMLGHNISYGGPIDSVKKVTRNLRNLSMGPAFRTKSEYCNIMYSAAAHALETVTGMPLADYFDEKIFKPLGMQDSHTDLRTPEKDLQNGKLDLAKGYYWQDGEKEDEGGRFVPEDYQVCPEVLGAGGIATNAIDYAK